MSAANSERAPRAPSAATVDQNPDDTGWLIQEMKTRLLSDEAARR